MRLHKAISFGSIFASRIAGAAALFAVNLLIVRYLGLESLATFAIFVSLVSIVSTLVSAGFSAIAPIYVAEYSSKKQPELLNGFVRTALKQGILLAGVVAALIALLTVLFLGPQGHIPAGMAPALVAAASASALLGFNGAVLVGMKKQVSGLLPETFVRPILFLIFTFVFVSLGLITSIGGVVWLLTVSIWITLGLVMFRDRNLHREISSTYSTTDQDRWRSASRPWMGISLLWDFMIDIVLLLTSLFAGSVEIAILHVCFRYRVLVGFGMRTIHTLLMPEIAEGSAIGDNDLVSAKLRQLNIASLAYSLAVLAGFAVLGDWLLGIFSIDDAGALSILLLVSATLIIRSVFGPAPLVLAIHQLHKITLWISLAGVLAAIAFIASTFSSLGILSAAIAYSGANLFISAALWQIAKRKTGIDCSVWSGIKLRMQRGGSSLASSPSN